MDAIDASAATTNAKTNAATTNAAIAASDTNNAIIVNAASAAVNDDLPHHQLNNEATTMPPSPSPAPLPVRGAVLRWMDTLPTTGIFSHMYYFASNMSDWNGTWTCPIHLQHRHCIIPRRAQAESV